MGPRAKHAVVGRARRSALGATFTLTLVAFALVAGCGGEERAGGNAPAVEPPEAPPPDPSTEAPEAAPPEPEGDPLPDVAPALALGGVHSCLADGEGLLRCWGGNQFGQLGDPGLERHWGAQRAVPAPVLGLSGARRVAAGTFHSCALLGTGRVVCWGHGGFGQLGDGAVEDRPAPVEVRGLSGVVALTAGEGHTCARLSTRRVWCWGRNLHGQLGDGGRSNVRPSAEVVPGLEDVLEIAAGREHTCALLSSGGVHCWGASFEGQLGDDSRHAPEGSRATPEPVLDIADATAIASGGAHSCALREGGSISCWGSNGGGQLGAGVARPAVPHPVAVEGLSDAVAVETGAAHTCALTAEGRVRCWGSNRFGQLGDGTRDNRRVPVEVRGLEEVVDLSVGARHGCARTRTGEVRCWGSNWRAQLGDGTTERRPEPVAVAGLR